MVIGTLKLKIYIPWSHSLKEKRMVVKSLCSKVSNKFNVSIAEVEDQDIHQTIVIGITFVTTDNAQSDRIGDNVINFIYGTTEGEILSIDRETWIY